MKPAYFPSIGLAIAIAAAALLTTTPASAQIAGNCDTSSTRYKAAFDIQSTTSTTFVNVPGMAINFVQGGSTAGCAIVSFSAEAGAGTANGIMQIRAMLDGATPCQPEGSVFVRSNATVTSYALRAIELVCPSVAPGAHFIRMQFVSPTGGQVDLFQRTMLVHYVR